MKIENEKSFMPIRGWLNGKTIVEDNEGMLYVLYGIPEEYAVIGEALEIGHQRLVPIDELRPVECLEVMDYLAMGVDKNG